MDYEETTFISIYVLLLTSIKTGHTIKTGTHIKTAESEEDT